MPLCPQCKSGGFIEFADGNITGNGHPEKLCCKDYCSGHEVSAQAAVILSGYDNVCMYESVAVFFRNIAHTGYDFQSIFDFLIHICHRFVIESYYRFINGSDESKCRFLNSFLDKDLFNCVKQVGIFR